MVSIQVFSNASGKSLGKGKKVSISFKGLLRGHSTEYTDSSGTAHFNVDPGSGDVYVSGKKVHTGAIRGMVRVYA